jgi:hypothetical protein
MQCCDRHRFNADPDPNFHVNTDPDPDPDWHQYNACPHADPTPSFTVLENLNFYFIFSHNIPTFNVGSFSSVSNVSCFQYFRQHIEIFRESLLFYQPFNFLGINTDRDRPDPDPSK